MAKLFYEKSLPSLEVFIQTLYFHVWSFQMTDVAEDFFNATEVEREFYDVAFKAKDEGQTDYLDAIRRAQYEVISTMMKGE